MSGHIRFYNILPSGPSTAGSSTSQRQPGQQLDPEPTRLVARPKKNKGKQKVQISSDDELCPDFDDLDDSDDEVENGVDDDATIIDDYALSANDVGYGTDYAHAFISIEGNHGYNSDYSRPLTIEEAFVRYSFNYFDDA